jgi:hypothetical protein
MVKLQLLKLSLLTTFGRRAKRPLLAAMLRLTGLVLVALGVTWVLLPSLRQLPLALGLPALWWLALIAVGVQLLIAVSLLLAQGVVGGSSVLARLLMVWPIRNIDRWLVLKTPLVVLAGLLLLILFQPLMVLSDKLDISSLLIISISLVAAISSFGMAVYQVGTSLLSKLLIISLLAGAEILLVKQLTDTYLMGHKPGMVWYLVLLGLLLAPLLWLGISICRFASDLQSERRRSPLLLPTWNKLWYLGKFMRNRRTASNFLICFMVSALLAFSLHAQPGSVGDGKLYFLLAAMLASSLATDIRGIARLSAPAEISALWGTRRFVSQQMIVAILGAFVAVSPLGLMAISLLSSQVALHALNFCALIFFAISIGLCVAEFLVTDQRDVSGQFVAAIMSIGLLLGLPKVTFLGYGGVVRQSLGYLLLAGLLVVISWVVEQRRNNFVWRS